MQTRLRAGIEVQYRLFTPTSPTLDSNDKIYAHALDTVTGFRFDQRVASVFEDMISRSVPGYRTTLSLITDIAARFARPGSTLYDLGSSLGGATLAMQRGVSAPDCKIVAVDSSQAMIDQCQATLGKRTDPQGCPIELLCADLREVPILDASMVVMNFTLQFIPPSDRDALMQRIANGMQPGDALVLSEKLVFDDDKVHRLFIELHENFKRSNGYSDLEIAQKRSALENVMIPDTLQTHQRRLAAAGFSRVELWFQCLNFASILAIK